MTVLRTIGLLGPIRRLAHLGYAGTCPACRERHALTVLITPAGERPSCRTCLLADVLDALKELRA